MIKILLVTFLFFFGSIYSASKKFNINVQKFLELEKNNPDLNEEVIVADSSKNIFIKLDESTKTNFLNYFKILTKLNSLLNSTYIESLQTHLKEEKLFARFYQQADNEIIEIGAKTEVSVLSGKMTSQYQSPSDLPTALSKLFIINNATNTSDFVSGLPIFYQNTLIFSNYEQKILLQRVLTAFALKKSQNIFYNLIFSQMIPDILTGRGVELKLINKDGVSILSAKRKEYQQLLDDTKKSEYISKLMEEHSFMLKLLVDATEYFIPFGNCEKIIEDLKAEKEKKLMEQVKENSKARELAEKSAKSIKAKKSKKKKHKKKSLVKRQKKRNSKITENSRKLKMKSSLENYLSESKITNQKEIEASPKIASNYKSRLNLKQKAEAEESTKLNLYRQSRRNYKIFRFRLRQIGPHLALTSGSILGSYLLAIYADSKKTSLNQDLNLSKRLKYSEPNGVIESIQNFWEKSRESQKTIFSLIAVNSVFCLAWRIPVFNLYLEKYCSHSINSHPLGMLGSIFLHVSPGHLLYNMLFLYNFGTFLHEKMGREQFLAFYISTGMASSLASHIHRCILRNYTTSIGASGAILGVAGGCAHFPEFKVNELLPVIIGIDTLGLLLKWKNSDHAAHLGGSLSGYFMYPLSQNYIWKNRKEILRTLGF